MVGHACNRDLAVRRESCHLGAALGVAGTSVWYARKQFHLAERLRGRDFEATVVVKRLGGVGTYVKDMTYSLRVTNAGPAVARDVSVELQLWTDGTELGRSLHRVDVAPAMLRGEQRNITLRLPLEESRFDDRSRSLEIHADYYNDSSSAASLSEYEGVSVSTGGASKRTSSRGVTSS